MKLAIAVLFILKSLHEASASSQASPDSPPNFAEAVAMMAEVKDETKTEMSSLPSFSIPHMTTIPVEEYSKRALQCTDAPYVGEFVQGCAECGPPNCDDPYVSNGYTCETGCCVCGGGISGGGDRGGGDGSGGGDNCFLLPDGVSACCITGADQISCVVGELVVIYNQCQIVADSLQCGSCLAGTHADGVECNACTICSNGNTGLDCSNIAPDDECAIIDCDGSCTAPGVGASNPPPPSSTPTGGSPSSPTASSSVPTATFIGLLLPITAALALAVLYV